MLSFLVIASLDFLALDKRATALYISVKTVGTHRMQLMKQRHLFVSVVTYCIVVAPPVAELNPRLGDCAFEPGQ